LIYVTVRQWCVVETFTQARNNVNYVAKIAGLRGVSHGRLTQNREDLYPSAIDGQTLWD